MTKPSWLPAELFDYLRTLISPPGGGELLIMDLIEDPMPKAKNHYHGAIVRGTPSPKQSKKILKRLRPGAHLFLVAPDSEPTGHTGACNVEDAGFEIRDAIAWVRQEGHVHYVPKVKSKKERHAGTGGLNNEHVTVKPIKLMERLLKDIPKDKIVGDYFMGSGSTGIAALRTGHDFIGIELEAESLATAEKRIKHWDAEEVGWNRAEITSDLPGPEPEPKGAPMDLSDFMSGGG
jgi:DNA modification methylase